MKLFFLAGLFCGLVSGQERKITQNAFAVGEKLTFSIGWEFISAGTAVLAVESTTTLNNRSVYHITATTESNAFFSTMYRVRNKLESFVDTEGIYPIRYVKKTQEGGTSRDFTVDFDQAAHVAQIADRDSGNSQVKIPPFVQDIISAFYYVRTLPMDGSQTMELATFDNGRWKNAKVDVVRKEKISVDAGEFDCVVVKTPIGPFNNKSDLLIWLTDDQRKIPVLMKSKIAVGSIRAELEKISK